MTREMVGTGRSTPRQDREGDQEQAKLVLGGLRLSVGELQLSWFRASAGIAAVTAR